jgi:hypothetical protein
MSKKVLLVSKNYLSTLSHLAKDLGDASVETQAESEFRTQKKITSL